MKEEIVSPEERVASAIEGSVRFVPRAAVGSDSHCYEAVLRMGRKAFLEVSLVGEPEGVLEVAVAGKPEARVRFNKDWLEFWPFGSNEAQENVDPVLGAVERLAKEAQEAGGNAFRFECSTPLGLRTVTSETNLAACSILPRREPRFKLHPKPGETRDPERIDRVLSKLEDVWKARPDMRLGQLVSVLAAKSGTFGGDAFMVEDDDFETVLDEMNANNPTAPASPSR